MEFPGMVAHLLHPLKSNVTFLAHVQLLLVKYLLVLHELFHLAEFSAADRTNVSLEYQAQRAPCWFLLSQQRLQRFPCIFQAGFGW
jgi:hypothetical protein